MPFLAIHAGAGLYDNELDKICSNSLRRAVNSDSPEADAESLLLSSIMALEENPELNCGIGSNLNRNGYVECEASYMLSKYMSYGAVACVTNCLHPVFAASKLAHSIAQEQSAYELINPMVLAGKGADEYCAQFNMGIVNNSMLITEKAKNYFLSASKIANLNMDSDPNNLNYDSKEYKMDTMDTVGGVLINEIDGTSASCSSSGGIFLKPVGRIGPSGQFGAAIWSESRGSTSVSISLSGCGEAIIRTHLAESIASQLFNWIEPNCSEMPLVSRIDEFLSSSTLSYRLKQIHPSRRRFGGLILIKFGARIELIIFHNTKHFAFAYCTSNFTIKRTKSTIENYDSNSFNFKFDSFALR